MTPQQTLALAATHVDDALEFLTFERRDWSLDALWRAVALVVGGETGAHLAAAVPVDALPAEGALSTLSENPLAEAVETLCDEFRRSGTVGEGIDTVVFAASDAVRRAAKQRALVDPGRAYGALAGAEAPRRRPRPARRTARSAPAADSALGRRRALQLMGLGSAGLVACTRPAASPAASAQGAEATTASAATTSTVPAATVRAISPIDAMQWPTSDPFLFCAHHVDAYPQSNGAMGPDASLAGRNLGRDFDPNAAWRMYHGEAIPGFPRHPHRGFETVTVVRTGLLDHADSMGATARYGGGDVQWLTAGGGIQHAEMFPLLRDDADNPLELFQIWLNLPARNKMVQPHFTMLWSDDIPRVTVHDDAGKATEVTIAAGRYGDHAPPAPPPNSWASDPASDLAIWSLRMEPGATFSLPPVEAGTERSLYFHVGDGGRVADTAVPNRRRVEIDGRGPVSLTAGSSAVEILLLQARPIGEPIARRGPFVMNTPDEIQQAYRDYRSTGFGGWPWGDNAPVHDAQRGRFAQRPDGTIEEPT